MPVPGKRWRHVIFGTHGSWLPGDPRGWRSHRHKRHSSGDYKQPPPEGEHAGLYHYSQQLCSTALTIPADLRATVGDTFLAYFESTAHRLLVLSVGGQHVHLLVELPVDLPQVSRIVGDAKRKASRRVRVELPGRVWAARGKFLTVDDTSHHRRAYRYIRNHVLEGAWVWTFREGIVAHAE